jgi:hypothetical protein
MSKFINDVHVFQFIRKDDGTRSKPFLATFVQLADSIENAPPEQDCYVLVIGAVKLDEDATLEDAYSPFPLVGTDFFCRWVKNAQGEDAA